MDAVFVALADATRRRVLELLATGGGATATQLATEFPVTRQAIAKHLQVLHDAGLVRSARSGRETRWAITPDALAPAMTWMAELGGTFDARVDALQRHLADRAAGRRLGNGPRPPSPLHIAASGRPEPPSPR